MKKKDRCGQCMFRARKEDVFRCDYASIMGKTRKAQPPERCTYFRAGERRELT